MLSFTKRNKTTLRTNHASCQDLSQRKGGVQATFLEERGGDSPEAVDAVDRLEVRGLDGLDTQPATQTHTLYNDSEDTNVRVCVEERVFVFGYYRSLSVSAQRRARRTRCPESERLAESDDETQAGSKELHQPARATQTKTLGCFLL